ncbi:MAG: hypothetical protein M1549_04135, partial [Candidatus Dependentiae bacterium]|nr:hypothetical protein [Candidatus Dependentiae bacterium]
QLVQSAEEAELISAIPGTTFHIIDKIRLKQAVINVMDPILWTARCLFRTMRLEEMPDVRKLVHIKSIEGIPDMQSYEVWLIRDGKEFSMLVVAKKDTDERIRLLYETAEPLTKPKRTTLTEEGVRAWIKEFNKEIVICKRLAYLLEPYRFLKNAEIETEMPDFIEL